MSTRTQMQWLPVAVSIYLGVSPVWAQDGAAATPMDQPSNAESTVPIPVPNSDLNQMQGMDHSGMNMQHNMPANDHAKPARSVNSNSAGMDHGDMQMQGGSAPPDTRDPHANSGGYTLDAGPYVLPGPRQLRMADEHNFGGLMIDRLERVYLDEGNTTAYDAQAWYGRYYNRLVLKAEGDISNGKLEEASTELLWGHAIATFWDTQVGVRYDSGEGPNRTWLAFGVQGLAPYWFEVDATAYVGEQGRTALGLEAEYDLLLTQRLILQPRVEAAFYGKNDQERMLGKGLSDVAFGLRLRYEIRREFAPYIGVEWSRKFGDTKVFTLASGQDANEVRGVAGVRFWF